jgi:hypothetical protein
VKRYKQYKIHPNRFPRQHLKHSSPQKKELAKTRKAGNTTTRQAKSKVKKGAAKTKIEAKKITSRDTA